MAKKEEGTPIDLRERVTVYSTDKDKYHTTGDAMNVAPAVAEKLIKNGMATKDATKGSQAKPDAK